RGGFVGRLLAGIDDRLGHCAIQEARVEMAQAVMGREPLAERALARRGGSIERDDHDKSAPSERISSTKPGKLVAMKAPSSMRTGSSDARPMTSADIAMRWSMCVVTSPPPFTL